jgi:CMP-N,N'-diacetyllegionaminic acid synthase
MVGDQFGNAKYSFIAFFNKLSLLMTVYGIIPARSGSKSLPDKNITLLMGHPLLSYSISTALRCDFIDQVYVTSDSENILHIAEEYGANKILRPTQISGDLSRDVEYLAHFADVINDVNESDVIVLLRPTHPLRNISVLNEAYDCYKSAENIDSLRSMKRNQEIVFKSWHINPDGFAIPLIKKWPGIDDAMNAPRQILPKTFYQDGYIDIFSFNTVLNSKSTSGEKVLPFLIEEFSVDIDTSADMDLILEYVRENELPKWFNMPVKKHV